MKKGWSGGKIAAVIIGIILAVMILGVAFVASVFHLSQVLETIFNADEAVLFEWEEEVDEAAGKSGKDVIKKEKKSSGQKKHFNEEDSEDEKASGDKSWEDFDFYEDEYYEFENALTDGLAYEVTFENYIRDDFSEEEDGLFLMECNYPVVSGQIPNLEGINKAIFSEVKLIEEHVEQVAGFLEDSKYEYLTTSYVTYMSEEILSIAYVEYVYLDDDFFESYVVSVNVDMETGLVMKNNQLLDIDDAFSIEFRKRCEKQNGEIEDISDMSDQEITAYLKEEESLIVFYTPIGMEVGFNYFDGWVTVTYSQYQKYRQF